MHSRRNTTKKLKLEQDRTKTKQKSELEKKLEENKTATLGWRTQTIHSKLFLR